MLPLTAFLSKITSRPQTVTLAIENPRIKPALVKKIVAGLVDLGDITYFDYDLQFSSFLQNISEDVYSEWISRGPLVLQPGYDLYDFVEGFSSLSKVHKGGVFILDSINSLQTLLSGNNSPQTPKIANYKTSILLSVLQLVARSYAKSFVVFDLTKLRPRIQTDQTVSWEKELVGGRMIRYKSDSIYFVSETKSTQSYPWSAKRIQLQGGDRKENPEIFSIDL